MMAQPLVQFDDVQKSYSNGVVALRSISLTIAQGEFVTLLGPSGCGKSTILRIIAGLTRPTSGTVHYAPEGQPATKRSSISCVFQDPTLLPWATVWDNVYLPLRVDGRRRDMARQQVDEALRRVNLFDFASAYPRQLSGGMRMRASLARALVIDPHLVLLDEPFAALDEFSRQALNDEILALWRSRGWTTLFITHSVLEAVYLSTRVVVMSPRPGQIAADFSIDLPKERTNSLRTAPQYLELCRHISTELSRLMPQDSGPSL